MQVTETLSQGLKHEFKVTLKASDLAARADQELDALKGRVQLNGFRPGKVPTAHLKRLYGRSVMADVVQNAVNDANKQIIDDKGFKLALEPQIKFPENPEDVTKVMEGQADLAYDVAFETLPTFEIADFSGLKVEKLNAEVPAEDVKAELERLAKQNRTYAPKGDKAKVADGDRVSVDFVGSIDGTPFEGGKGEGIKVEIGSNTFIPGFEEGLLGAKAGEKREIKATFPAAYAREDLAGKEAVFDVTVNEIEAPGETVIDDELAKKYGLESLANLEEAIRENIGRELAAASRAHLKRQLLDALDEQYTFDLPPTLLEQEFGNVWQQVLQDMQSQGKTFPDEDGTTEEEAKAEYRRISERRVRLGLVLAQIGEDAKVQVTDEEVSQALIARARQFPGQEKMVWEYYRKNPQALAELRAPIFEEKVVDHILASATVTEKTVSKAELLADEEGEGEGEAKKKPAKKPSKAKKKD